MRLFLLGMCCYLLVLPLLASLVARALKSEPTPRTFDCPHGAEACFACWLEGSDD